MNRTIANLMILCLLGTLCCIDPLAPKNVQYNEILVVDGFISTAAKPYTVALSTTSDITNKRFIPETGATVSVEDKGGNTISFSENKPGMYESPVFSGVVGEGYTLHITRSNGREYASEEVALKSVPPIANIYAKYFTDTPGTGPGIQIYLDARDSTSQTRFYRWDYVETYEIHQPYPNSFEWLGGNNVVFRNPPVDVCWASDTLQNIFIRTTQGLEKDEVTQFPLRFISAYDYVMRIKYSILVRQFALSEEGFLFWDNLRVINENQGSLFDVQPGTLRGNIFSLTDSKENVLGYFDASAVYEKRAFFSPVDFKDAGYVKPKYLTGCENFQVVMVPEDEIGDYMTHNRDSLVISESVGSGPVTFYMRPKYCCDCTNLGTNIKPPFWQ